MATWYYSTGNSTTDSGTAGGYYSCYSTATSAATNYTYAEYDPARRATCFNGVWVTDYERCQNPEAYETEEQKRARLERQAQYDRDQERIRKEQEEAEQRAEELLKSHIGIEAFGKLYQVGYIELDSQKYKGRKYRVSSQARNQVEILEDGKVVDRLCVHPTERYQDADEILARLTLLQYAEEYLLKVANHYPVRA